MGYLANFMVYTLAMVGVIVVALLVFKNATTGGCVKKSKYLKIVDTMSLAPRKTLYIVSTGREKFLIAGDVDKTTLISKLETGENLITEDEPVIPSPGERARVRVESATFQQTMSALNKTPSFMDKSNIGIKSSMLSSKTSSQHTSVIKNLAERLK